MSETTVPGDLLPGLLRIGPVLFLERGVGVGEESGAGLIDMSQRAPVLEFCVDPMPHKPAWCRLTRGRCKVANVLIDLATPTGWDAAVACLARRCWPDMEATDRAEFCHADGLWTLFAPARLQRPKPRPPGFTPCVVWACAGGADDPVAALRAVLLHEAGRL